jgi:hypothetical protein
VGLIVLEVEMANPVKEAVDDLRSELGKRSRDQKIIFDEYVTPFFEEAKAVCDDAMQFYRNFRMVANELTSQKFRDEEKFVAFIKEKRPAIEQMRNKMLNDRLHLEKRGAVLTGAKWFTDASVASAVDDLVSNVLLIIREYDGVGSRPKTLIDGLDLLRLTDTPQQLFALSGGLNPIIERSEKNWSDACLLYEQLRAFFNHGIRPSTWGTPIDENTYSPVSKVRRFWRGTFSAVKILLLVLSLLIAIVAVVKSLGENLNSKFQQISKP